MANMIRDFISGFAKADTPEGMIGNILEAYAPLGRITSEGYKSPEELYGPAFMTAPVEVRRRVLANLNEQRKERASRGGEEGMAQTVGEFAGSILKSPGSLFIPVGKTVQAGAVNGFAFGSIYEAADQKLNTGEIDVGRVAMMGAIGGVFGGGFNGALNVLGRKVAARKAQTAQQAASAEHKLQRIEESISWAKREGVPESQMAEYVANDLGLENVDDVWAAYYGASRRPTTMDNPFMENFTKMKNDSVGWVSENFDNLAVPIMTRIEKISPTIAARVRKYEYDALTKAAYYDNKVKPFVQGLNSLSKAGRERVSLHLFNGRFKEARAAAAAQGMEARTIDDVINVLDEVHTAFKDKKLATSKLENYFPRTVTNWKKLHEAMGQNGTELDRMFRQHARKLKRPVDSFTDEERAWFVQNFIKGKSTNVQTQRGSERRSFDVTEKYLPFYKDAGSSLVDYLHRAADELAAADLFTANVKKPKPIWKNKEKLGRVEVDHGLDVEKNVDAMLTEMHGYDVPGYGELAELLQARLKVTREPTWKAVNVVRSIGYMNTIGNAMSALTQLGDLGVSVVTQGLRPTLRAVFGAKKVDLAELGIRTALDADLANVGALNRSLNGALKWSGFAAIDKFGKNTVINAALRRNQALARKNPKKFAEKWRTTFGDEIDQVRADLVADDLSENVRLMLFNELSDVQPISLSEMPAAYLNNPNMRIFYMLKTFALKQLDLLRKRGVDQIAKGNYAQGGKFIASYITVFGGMGATVTEIKHGLTGRGFNVQDIPDNYVDTLMGIFLMNRYMGQDIQKGNIVDAAASVVVPPLDWVNAVAQDVAAAVKTASEGGRFDEVPWKTGREIPMIGPWWGQLLDSTMGQHNVRDRLSEDSAARRESAGARLVRDITK